jgi:short-subunit dehydrogenase
MSINLKPLHQQILFITGATSGIGLATVHRAVEQGAKVFMVARNEDELQKIQDDMRHKGYDTAYAVADVGEIDQLQFAVDQCLKTFGGIDTFVNNAGISIYGRVLETTIDESKKLFETNFWGVVNGCKVAVPVLREKGGVIINIGSVLSNVALPIQGIYSASKHAVKGYTDALRRELMAEKAPIQVTLLLPSAIDTPYPEHARSLIGEPMQTPPVYAADVVALAILKCATKPTRELGVGSTSFLLPVIDRLFPRLQDRYLSKRYMEKKQSRQDRIVHRNQGDAENLFVAPMHEGIVQGQYPGHVMKSSLMTKMAEKKVWLKGGAFLRGFTYLFMRRFRLF